MALICARKACRLEDHALQGVPPQNETCCFNKLICGDNHRMWITDPKTGRKFSKKCRRRFDSENTPRELTFSCYHGYPFFSRDRTCQWFVDAVEAARQKWSFDLWAWVLMPEHVHLILALQEASLEVGTIQGFVKERVARQAIGWLEQNATSWIPRITVREGLRTRRRFWQPGGGYDRNIESVDTLENMIDYIHLNPVRRGLVKKAIDWPWSSARWYAGLRPAIIEIDTTMFR
jgi:putative transposase